MRRRGFSALLSGAIAWPLVTSAQPSLRVAALWPFAEGSADGNAVLGALRQGLRERGRPNVQIDNRWGGGNIERSRAYAAEIVKSSPDVIFAYFNTQLSSLFRETRTIPIVFVGASDPVGAGYVTSLTRPGGNVTGFTLYEPALASKWLEILKQVAAAVSASPCCHPVMPAPVAYSPAMAISANLLHTRAAWPPASAGRLSVTKHVIACLSKAGKVLMSRVTCSRKACRSNSALPP